VPAPGRGHRRPRQMLTVWMQRLPPIGVSPPSPIFPELRSQRPHARRCARDTGRLRGVRPPARPSARAGARPTPKPPPAGGELGRPAHRGTAAAPPHIGRRHYHHRRRPHPSVRCGANGPASRARAPPPRWQRPSSPSPSQWARVQPQADDLSGRRRVQEDLYAPVCNHKTLWDGAYGRPFWHALPDCTSYKPPRNRLISTNQTPLCVPIRVAFGGRSRTARGPFLRRFFFCLPLGTGPTAGIVCFVAWVPLTVVRGSGPFTLYSSAVLRFA